MLILVPVLGLCHEKGAAQCFLCLSCFVPVVYLVRPSEAPRPIYSSQFHFVREDSRNKRGGGRGVGLPLSIHPGLVDDRIVGSYGGAAPGGSLSSLS